PQIGGMIAAANGKLMQVNGVAPTEEVLAVTMIVLPLMGTLFAPLPNDAETYNAAADKIAGYAKQFAEKQTGENLSALDALISATPPHFSQQFKDKYLVPAEDK
ncbi:MAG: hypothetical protein HON04_16695, partial [Planctomicrobium sp.]|nr:hypothetical protein [Planctomicrobium sp.]